MIKEIARFSHKKKEVYLFSCSMFISYENLKRRLSRKGFDIDSGKNHIQITYKKLKSGKLDIGKNRFICGLAQKRELEKVILIHSGIREIFYYFPIILISCLNNVFLGESSCFKNFDNTIIIAEKII